jgi:energy-coupling factor transporter ATP-binding protein EcfA2
VGQEGQEGVLLTGMFGTGKSTILKEIAIILEERGVAFAAIDLDWLAWYDVPGGPSEHEMLLRNLAAVVGTYVAEGVRWFVFARSLEDLAVPNEGPVRRVAEDILDRLGWTARLRA